MVDRCRDVAAVFDRAAPKYGRVGEDFFGYFGSRLVRLAQLGPGCKFLDVGCGSGAMLVPAAALVGNNGPAVGVDVSREMLAHAHLALTHESVAAALMVGDAQRLPFRDGVFDVLGSSFAFTYFSTPIEAAIEMRRVLRPGGRLAVAVSDGWWFQGDPEWRWHEELLRRLGAPLGAGRFRDPTALVEVLEAGGFQVNEVVTEIFPLQWADVGDWWEANWSHGYRQVLEALPRWRLEAYRADCFARLQDTRPIRGRLEVIVALANGEQEMGQDSTGP